MSVQLREAVEQFGISCDECHKITHDYNAYADTWFHVAIPHREIEKMEAVTFCMPAGNFCSIGCFSGFGDRLVRLQIFGTDAIPPLAPKGS